MMCVLWFYSVHEEALLMLVDGPAALPEQALREPTWYALFFFLREVGTMRGSIGELIGGVTSARTPEDQLQMLNVFQPALSEMSQDEWDEAVYRVLDTAAMVTRLMGTQVQESKWIRSPVTIMQSADKVGQSFDRATKALCAGSVQHIKLETPHTECLLTE